MSTHGRFGWLTGVAVAVVMLGTLAVGVSQAQQRAARGRAQWQRGAVMPRAPLAALGFNLRQLGLTDQQRQQVRTIVTSHAADFRAIADRAVPARRALTDAIATGDEGAIRQRSQDLGAVQTDRALLAARVRAEVFKLLTPEQQQKAQLLRQQAQERRDRFGTRRPGRGGILN